MKNSLNVRDQKTLRELWEIFESANQPLTTESSTNDASHTGGECSILADRHTSKPFALSWFSGDTFLSFWCCNKIVKTIPITTSAHISSIIFYHRCVLCIEFVLMQLAIPHADKDSVLEDTMLDEWSKPRKTTKSKKEVVDNATLDDQSKPKKEKRVKSKKEVAEDITPDESSRPGKKKDKMKKEVEESSGDHPLKSMKKDKQDEEDTEGKKSAEEDGEKRRKKKRKHKHVEKDRVKLCNGANAETGVEDSLMDPVSSLMLHKKQRKERKQEDWTSDHKDVVQISPVALAVEEISSSLQRDRKRKPKSYIEDGVDGDGRMVQNSAKKRRDDSESGVSGIQRKASSKKHKHKKN